MKKTNELLKSWNNNGKKRKMPKSKQDFINKKEPIEIGLKKSSGSENVKGFVKTTPITKKINEMASNLFNNDINNYMKNNNSQKSKFDLLFENILNGMSPDEQAELGVEATDDSSENLDDSQEYDNDNDETVTITLTKSQKKLLHEILSKLDEDFDDSEDSSEEDDGENDEEDDEEDFEEDWSEEGDFEEDFEEDNEVADGSSFGEGIETEVVGCEKGKKYMNKASNKVGGKISVKGGTANKGSIPEGKADPEVVGSEKGKKYMDKGANKVSNKLNPNDPLF